MSAARWRWNVRRGIPQTRASSPCDTVHQPSTRCISTTASTSRCAGTPAAETRSRFSRSFTSSRLPIMATTVEQEPLRVRRAAHALEHVPMLKRTHLNLLEGVQRELARPPEITRNRHRDHPIRLAQPDALLVQRPPFQDSPPHLAAHVLPDRDRVRDRARPELPQHIPTDRFHRLVPDIETLRRLPRRLTLRRRPQDLPLTRRQHRHAAPARHHDSTRRGSSCKWNVFFCTFTYSPRGGNTIPKLMPSGSKL